MGHTEHADRRASSPRRTQAERRAGQRQDVWFPVRVDAEGSPSWVTVCRDASGAGMLLAAPAGSSFTEGMRVDLTFRTPQDDVVDTVRGRIVRRVANSIEEAFLWPHLLGIEFDQPHERLRRLTETIARSRTPS